MQHRVVTKWKRQLVQTQLHVAGDRAEIAAPDIRLHVDSTGARLALDDIWRRPNANIGYFSQPNALPGRRVDQHLADRVHAVAGFRRRPHLHVVGAAAEEDVADLLSGHEGRGGTPDIARLQTVALCFLQLHRHLNVRYFDHQLLVQVDEIRDISERRANLLRLVPENVEIRAEDADDDRLTCAGQDLANALLQIGLHIPVEAGIALHHFLDPGMRLVVVGIPADADPVLPEIDADNFVSGEGLADMGAEVAYARNGAQFLACAGGDTQHFGQRRVGRGDPVHQEVALPERGKQRLAEQRPNTDPRERHDSDQNIGHAWCSGDPFQQGRVSAKQPDDHG